LDTLSYTAYHFLSDKPFMGKKSITFDFIFK